MFNVSASEVNLIFIVELISIHYCNHIIKNKNSNCTLEDQNPSELDSLLQGDKMADKIPSEDEDEIEMYSPGYVHVGGLHTTFLSPSDMVLPLMCGICIHLTYVGLLIPVMVLFYNNYDNLESCMNFHWDLLLYLLVICHVSILVINVWGTCSSLRAKAGGTNKCLNILLTIRLFANIFEIGLVFYGLYVVFLDPSNHQCWKSNTSKGDAIYVLVIFFLLFNFLVLFTTWCCLYCCLSSSPVQKDPSKHSWLHKLCSACVYDETASQVTTSFYGMGGLINILSQGTKFTPAEIITGLHLLRMLQKHYGILDYNKRYKQNNEYYQKLDDNDNLLKELEYYTLYSNAAYGIPLYSMSSPCAICCAPPCCLPSNFDDSYSDQSIPDCDKLVIRQKKCCYPVQIDNSSLKIFIQRTECTHPQNDILMVSQYGGLHKVNFYVVADHHKKAIVIAIRGTLSLGDTITDANTEPALCEYIDTKMTNGDNCYVHKGIGQCAKDAFDKIMESKAIEKFIQNEEYKSYDLVITGHSVCCVNLFSDAVCMIEYSN